MATRTLDIFGAIRLPDTSGSVWYEPYPIKATNDFWGYGVWVFADTATKISVYGALILPADYVQSPVVKPLWTSTVTSGNVVWECAYRSIAGDDAESLDQATAAESPTVTDAAPTATDRLLIPSITLAGTGMAAGELLQFKLSRDGSSGSDTLVGAITLHGLQLTYADA